MVQSLATSWKQLDLPGTLGFAVPFWFDGTGGAVPDIGTASGLVTPLVAVLTTLGMVPGSYLNVMTYRTSPNLPGGTVQCFGGVLQTASRLHSPTTLLVGQELGEDPSEPTITFYGATWTVWASNMATLTSAFASSGLYGGIAADDATALASLGQTDH
jgi:hypothetical protein